MGDIDWKSEEQLLLALYLGTPTQTGQGRVERAVIRLLRQGWAAIPADMQALLLEYARSIGKAQGAVQSELDAFLTRSKAAGSLSPERMRSVEALAARFELPVASAARDLMTIPLIAGYENRSASRAARSSCIRALCGLAWLEENRSPVGRIGVERAFKVGLHCCDRLLPQHDEHRALVEAVQDQCDENQLLALLPLESPGWDFSDDYQRCQWGEELFHFTETQAEILRVLHEAWEDGEREVHGDTIRSRIEGVEVMAGSGPQWVDQILRTTEAGKKRKHPALNRLIVKPRRAYYGLCPPKVSLPDA